MQLVSLNPAEELTMVALDRIAHMTCISFGTWIPYALARCCFAGIVIGFSLRVGLDYAELATYRRIARRDP